MTEIGVIPVDDTLLVLLRHPHFSFELNDLDSVEILLPNLVAVLPAGNESLDFLVLILFGFNSRHIKRKQHLAVINGVHLRHFIGLHFVVRRQMANEQYLAFIGFAFFVHLESAETVCARIIGSFLMN